MRIHRVKPPRSFGIGGAFLVLAQNKTCSSVRHSGKVSNMGTSKARKRAVVIEDEVNISARVPREMKAAVIDLAKSRDRSASAEVRLALKAWLDDEERGVAA